MLKASCKYSRGETANMELDPVTYNYKLKSTFACWSNMFFPFKPSIAKCVIQQQVAFGVY